MIEAELMAALAQFGTAGLIGALWLWERRSASERERQLREAHERLIDSRVTLEALLGVVRANTEALQAISIQQRDLASIVRHVARDRPGEQHPERAESKSPR